MKHCESCKISIDTSKKQCPLCYDELEGEDAGSGTQLFAQCDGCDNITRKNYFLLSLFGFLSFSAAAICAFINIIATPESPWVIIVVTSIVYVWILISHTIMSRRSIFEKVLFQFVSFLSVALATNHISGGGNWFWPYVVPSAAITITTVLIFFSTVNKKRNDYLLSIFVMALLMTIVSIVLILTGTDHFRILNATNILYNVLFIAAILLFGFKSLKAAASKNLHV